MSNFIEFWYLLGFIPISSLSLNLTIPPINCEGNITCGNGEPHYMCMAPQTQCKPFELVKMNDNEIYNFLLGHNGLRNRVAKQYQISNMNIVHWSTKLQGRAEIFLKRCKVEPDTCQDVGPLETQINENYLFHIGLIGESWPAHLVRQWFNEFGYREVWKDFAARRKMGIVGNFSNLIYPLVKLIGCNGAHLPTGYLLVCFYWPRTLETYEDGFRYGEPCAQCDPHVPACSRVFPSLCGIDMEVPNGSCVCQEDHKRIIRSLFLLVLLNECGFPWKNVL